MYIYTLSFTNPRIVNGCESPYFYDFQSPLPFTDTGKFANT